MHVTSVIKDGSDDGYDVTADVFGWKKGREFLYKKDYILVFFIKISFNFIITFTMFSHLEICFRKKYPIAV